MSIRVLSARSPEWANQEKTAVNLLVRFGHIEGEIPFAATQDDTEKHGQELFAQAKAGKYGGVKPYSGPAVNEAKQQFEAMKARAVGATENRIRVLERAQRYKIADLQELEELRNLEVYSIELARCRSLPLPMRPQPK